MGKSNGAGIKLGVKNIVGVVEGRLAAGRMDDTVDMEVKDDTGGCVMEGDEEEGFET
jgi:hypothetical protein